MPSSSIGRTLRPAAQQQYNQVESTKPTAAMDVSQKLAKGVHRGRVWIRDACTRTVRHARCAQSHCTEAVVTHA